MLLRYAEQEMVDLFPADPANVRLNNMSTFELHQQMLDLLLDLNPANPRDHKIAGRGNGKDLLDDCRQCERQPDGTIAGIFLRVAPKCASASASFASFAPAASSWSRASRAGYQCADILWLFFS
jgi:hypothetical protein